MYKGSVTLLATSCTVGELPSLSSLGLKGALMTIMIIPTLYMVYMQTLEVIYTAEPLYSGLHQDPAGCPV